MDYNEVNTDVYGVIFRISPHITYIIGWWQIDQDGYEKWLVHLSEKSWFTKELCDRFTTLCTERKSAAFYN